MNTKASKIWILILIALHAACVKRRKDILQNGQRAIHDFELYYHDDFAFVVAYVNDNDTYMIRLYILRFDFFLLQCSPQLEEMERFADTIIKKELV